MGSTRIWYTPRGATRLARIDFGQVLRMRVGPSFVYRQSVAQSMGLVESSVLYSGTSQVRMQHTWTRDAAGTGDQLRRNLLQLVSHLQAGGSCMVAEDYTYAFAAFLDWVPAAGDTTLNPGANLFANLSSVSSIVGREFVTTSDPDLYLWDCKLVSGGTLDRIDFGTEQIKPDFTEARWILGREMGSYPALRIPREFRESGDFLTHDHEWLFNLDLPLEEDVTALEAMATYPGSVSGDDLDPTGTETPIDLGSVLEVPNGWNPTGTLRWP